MPSGPGHIRVGRRIPSVPLAELDSYGHIQAYDSDILFNGEKVLVIGVPGAFTPVCTTKHLPPIINNAHALRRSGFSEIYCIATSDPFTVDAWAKQVDPSSQIRFISDGNIEFARACGLTTLEHAFFLGQRSCRYSMVLSDAIVMQINVEKSVLDVSCSSAEALLDV